MLVPLLRGMRPPTRFFVHEVEEKSSIIERVLRLSEYDNRLNHAPLGVLHLERHLWMLRTSSIHIFDDYVIVQCVILNGLEARRRRRFENVTEHERCSKR